MTKETKTKLIGVPSRRQFIVGAAAGLSYLTTLAVARVPELGALLSPLRRLLRRS